MHPNTLSRGEGVSEADGSGMRVELIDLPLAAGFLQCSTARHSTPLVPLLGRGYGTVRCLKLLDKLEFEDLHSKTPCVVIILHRGPFVFVQFYWFGAVRSLSFLCFAISPG